MTTVREIHRYAAPGGRPQPLAFHDGTLWIGCWDTAKLYAVDPATGSVSAEFEAPGVPYGLAAFGGALWAVISLGEADDRYLFRFDPVRGFDLESKTPCPDLSGSHLTSDGTSLYLLQMGKRRLLALDADRRTSREIELPTACAGIGFAHGTFTMISADDEFDELQLGTLDIATAGAKLALLAGIPAESRGLAYDGNAWWTSYRENNAIASFAVADSQ